MIPIEIKTISTFKAEHQRAVMDYMNRPAQKNKLAAIERWIKKRIDSKYTFERLLVAPPGELGKIRHRIDTLGRFKYPQPILDLKKLYKGFSTERKTPFRLGAAKYSGYTFVMRTGVSVCPYCNRNYVINVPGEYRRTSELDHVYNQDKYPIFALCLFNLVPSCKVCNQIKWKKQGDYYNPYDGTVRKFPVFKVVLNSPLIFSDPRALGIKIQYPPSFKHNIENLLIEKIYSEHVDLVQDIVRKKHVYNATFTKQILTMLLKYKVSGMHLISGVDELTSLFLGAYLDEKSFHKRPFSKLTADVWKQIIKDTAF